MSRRHAAEKREVLPDAKYGDRVLTKFMNNLMVDGKKSVAETIVYSAMERVEGKLKRAPIEAFHEALDNVKPSLEVRSRRVGGATYQVPVEVRPERREALAIRWLITAAKNRNENTMEERLARRDGEFGAHLAQRLGHLQAQAARASGDEGDLPGQIKKLFHAHCCCSLVVRGPRWGRCLSTLQKDRPRPGRRRRRRRARCP